MSAVRARHRPPSLSLRRSRRGAPARCEEEAADRDHCDGKADDFKNRKRFVRIVGAGKRGKQHRNGARAETHDAREYH